MSSQPNDFAEADLNTALHASLLVTSTNKKYGRLWRRTLYIRIFISLTRTPRTPTATLQSEQLPHYTPLPTRTSSAKSSCTIDVAPDNEEEDTVRSELRIKNDIARIVKDKDLESLRQLGGVDRVRSVLCHRASEEGNTDNGSHQVLENTNQGRSLSYCFVNSCKRNSYTISLLMTSALLSLATEMKQEGPKYGWHDSAAILVTIIVIISFSSVANFWRERKMLKLTGKKMCLKMGDEVPADGLLLNNGNETQDIFLLFGSKVLFEGATLVLVTSVRNTKSVDMQNSAANNPEKNMLLESRIERPISFFDKINLLISALVMLVVLIRLLCKNDGDNSGLPEIKGKVSVDFLLKLMERIFLKPEGKVSILTSLVTVAIISMQHGVPLMVTISLKYQTDKVVSNQVADLHDLSSCATMGLVTAICVDASGGLMSKLMEVSRIRIGERDISNINEVTSEINQAVLDKLQQGVSVSILAPEFILSPVSNSLISWAETTWGVNRESLGENLTIVQHSRQNLRGNGNGVLVRKVGDHEKDLHSHWSGEAATILEMCSHYYDSDGDYHGIKNQKMKFGEVIKEMEDSGLEPIALAYRNTQGQALEQDGLILLALIGLEHLRLEETKKALEHLRNDGVKIKLVAGQDIAAVRALACELGIQIPDENGVILEGKEIQDLNSTARSKKLDEAQVMGGFLPDDKVLMIRCLQDEGHVVAFFGALTVSDAAVREAADIVIDAKSQNRRYDMERSNISVEGFGAITTIVRAGRCQYRNIQKFIQLQVTASSSGLFITLITTMCTGQSPLTAIELIWVNTIMCLLGGLMMLMNLDIKEDQHASQPNAPKQSLISPEIWKDIAIDVMYQASVSLIFLFGGQVTDRTNQVRKTMIFNIFMLCQFFNQLYVFGLVKRGIFKMVLLRYCLLVALGVCLIMQVLVIQYANSLANCIRLNATQWVICIVVGSLSWLIEWPLKKFLTWIFNHFHPCTI
ncbi:hypothetical protein QN277_019318 [Acacia crassicarpa]|uniref:Cation-transporting P-type ATPase C-terminal domain-containing protein n=1 Tax=Acacia crassicarpa TaxID=499986 RepID=A0AAE1JWC1_9FABA|nr:hypothetical protein QN277_019318 [Acacia crassicarpa]